MAATLRRRLADADFWERHANPASAGRRSCSLRFAGCDFRGHTRSARVTGWSRVPTGPLLVYAVYARNWRLLAATVAFVAVNPVLFRAPDPDADEGWMTRGVRGERLWLRGADAGRANRLNVAAVPVFLLALYSAVRRKPAGTAAFTALSMALKLGFVNEMAKLYERERRGREGVATDG